MGDSSLPENQAYCVPDMEGLTPHSLTLVVLVAFFGACPFAYANSEDDPLGIRRADDVVDVRTLLSRAERGDARASFLLGTRYASGRAGVRDDSEAVRWFTQASEAGLAEAQYNLGIMYANGRGVARNMPRAAYWYEQAAKQGVVEAQFNLGTLYGVGLGVDKDPAIAADWLRRAADKGLPEAEYNLGVLYEHGRGVRLDGQAAMEWYARAANKGYPAAGERLAALEKKMDAGGGSEEAESQELPLAIQTEALDNGIRSNAWIQSLKAEQFTLQLISQSSEHGAREFIRKRSLADKGGYFAWQKNGVAWFSVVYGVYETYEAAETASTSLPPGLADVKPWIRNVGIIHKLLN